MKSLLTFSTSLFLISFLSCSSPDTKDSDLKGDPVVMILDVKPLLNKSVEEVETVLGKIDKRESHTGYPCGYSKCEKVFFNKEKFEILFKAGKVDRITINSTPNLSDDIEAIRSLGLSKVEPSFQNVGTVIRYNDVDGINEVSFNYDFIYIIVNPAD